jgi:hypothetical protein
MSIFRLSTFLLTFVIAALTLAFANPSFAKGKECAPGDSRPKCAADPPAEGLTFTISMAGEDDTRGAFKITDEFATSEGDNALIGDEEITILSPAYNPDPEGAPFSCSASQTEDKPACETWSHVFNVCEIYNIYESDDPYGPNWFTAETGRNGWQVYKFTGGVRLFLATSILSPISPDPLHVTMTFISECAYSPDGTIENQPICGPFFPEGTVQSTTFLMDRFSNHARGKRNVAHAQECHAKDGELSPQRMILTITAE